MKKMICLLLCVILAVFTCAPVTLAYKNSLELPNQNAGLGDPYVLKYNGTYYLYGVVGGVSVCWSSYDLVNWEYEGCVFGDKGHTEGYARLYAPEVYYLDGTFYLYGSPDGKGHRVFISDNPLGPFEYSNDMYKSFDGTVFTDKDNTRYFLYCANNGVNYSTLETPKSTTSILNSISVSVANAWTEGPTMFLRNGKYYLTYTGNAVTNPNYRVEYALSDSPTENYIEPNNNTILLRTEGEIKGLGHNSVFVGPDLDTYYIIYHNNYKSAYGSLGRHINFDRILWNDEKLCVQGPTTTETENPSLPDFYVRFVSDKTSEFETNTSWTCENNLVSAKKATLNKLITKKKTEAIYTAEYNIKHTDNSGNTYAVFEYVDDNNYGRAYFNKSTNELVMEKIKSGQVEWKETSKLYSDYAYNALHSLKIRQTADTVTLLLEGTERCSHENKSTGGAIGYISENSDLTCGYTAFSNIALGNKDYASLKTVPGNNQAVHANNADKLKIQKASFDELGQSVMLQKGQYLSYSTDVSADGLYNFDISLTGVKFGTSLAVVVDGEVKKSVKLNESSKDADYYDTVSLRNISLKSGKHTVVVYLDGGSAEIYEVNIQTGDEVIKVTTSCDNLIGDDGSVIWKQYESKVASEQGQLCYKGVSSFGKALIGNSGWGDYSIDSDFVYKNGLTAGFMVRTAFCSEYSDEPSEFNDPYEHRGYYIGLSNNGIVLEKHNLSETKELLKLKLGLEIDKQYHVRIECKGMNITLLLDNKEIFSYTDRVEPYTMGAVGIRNYHGKASYDNIVVMPINDVLEKTDINIPANLLSSEKNGESEKASSTADFPTIPVVVIGLTFIASEIIVVAVILIKKKVR